MKIYDLSIDKIVPFERNAKKHDETQVANVAESIKQFGFAQPLVVDKDNILIIGHCRLLAAKRLGLEKVPVLKMDELTPEQVDKLRLLDNKLNESEWDWDLLKEDIPALDFSGFDIDWGITELEDITEIEDDEVPEVEETEPICKKGDVWKLGGHRLICGDSTDRETIAKLMNGEQADLYLTDPPYNVNYEEKAAALNEWRPNKNGAMKIENDKMGDEDFYIFLRSAFETANKFLKDGGAFYIWHADMEGLNFRQAVRDTGWPIKECLIWNKNILVIGRQDYQWKHEPCLYGWKEGAAHYFVDDRKQTTVFADKEEINPKKMKKDELVRFVEEILSDKISTTVINEDKPSASALHPTMKPIKLLARQIRNSTKKDELVYDGFGGSGSTLIACEQLGRRCYTCELDERYCDVIIQRWETLTGQKAIKEN